MIMVGPLIGAIFVLVCLAVLAARVAPGWYRWFARQTRHFRMWLSTVALIPKMKVIRTHRVVTPARAATHTPT